MTQYVAKTVWVPKKEFLWTGYRNGCVSLAFNSKEEMEAFKEGFNITFDWEEKTVVDGPSDLPRRMKFLKLYKKYYS